MGVSTLFEHAGEISVMARRTSFSAAHFYSQAQFNAQKNAEVFGLCHDPYGHGHNYVLEVLLRGPVAKDTGLIANLLDIDIALREVVEPLEHRHLNHVIPEFKNDKVPTTENIALFLLQRLQTRLRQWPQIQCQSLRLFENEDLWVEVQL